jgi:hypothetical protein
MHPERKLFLACFELTIAHHPGTPHPMILRLKRFERLLKQW